MASDPEKTVIRAAADDAEVSSPELRVDAPHGGAYEAMEAIADVALAPMAEIRKSPWLLRLAMLAAVLAAAAAPWVAWQTNGEDWGVYLAAGVATAILVGNFMRWRRRWGWFRRGFNVALALLVLAAWSALLVDRAVAGLRHDAHLLLAAASPWFWLPVGLNVATAVLVVLHYIIGTRREHARAPIRSP